MKELGNHLWQMFTRPVSKFLEEGILGGLLLIVGTLCCAFLANSPFQDLTNRFSTWIFILASTILVMMQVSSISSTMD
jgi:hypothetical protein